MNIVREQREQNNSLIKVTVGEKDYGDAVEKSLREYKRKANIPGFRPGMVPMGVIKKMYGKGVLAEQAYRQASEAAFNYLQEQKIDYVGDVIPSEEQGDFDFENGTEFEFIFLRRTDFDERGGAQALHRQEGRVQDAGQCQ